VRTFQVPSQTLGLSTTQSNAFDEDNFRSDGPAAIYVDVSAITGVGATLVVTLEEKDPVSGNWVEAAAPTELAAITAVGTFRAEVVNLPGSSYRLKFDISGTTPSVTFSAALVTKDRG